MRLQPWIGTEQPLNPYDHLSLYGKIVLFMLDKFVILKGSPVLLRRAALPQVTPWPVLVHTGKENRFDKQRSLINQWNKAGPGVDPWGTPLTTGLQLDSVLLIMTL